MQVRCVECHEPIDVAEDTQFGSMTCPSCGSAFSLLGEQTVAYDGKPGDDTDFVVRTLGHFELVDLLGSGSFGSVWMARDIELDRTVAVKIPRKGQLDAEEAEQFLREARAAAQLQHPNIVAVHEVGREDDTVYIVNDFVRGMPMDEWIAEQQLTQREAAELCATIADALDHAHEAGITHRDLKPGNIMIDLAGEPHIMDFGLAKREVGEITMTVAGRILGTPAYMPPEQARGEGHKADRRSDIYSLGVILYRLLTGELPFRGSPQMLILQILRDEPPSPRKLDGHVARDLETICLKCMEKAPEARYQTSAEVRDELRRWLAGEPIVARPISRTERLWRWSKRNPGLAGLTGAVAALLVVIAVGSLVAAARLAVARNEAVEAQGVAEHNEQAARLAERQAETARNKALASAEEARAQRNRADGNFRLANTQTKLALEALDELVRGVQRELADTAGTYGLKRRLLETAFAKLRDVAAAAADERFIESADATMAEAHQRMGEIFEILGSVEQARDEYATTYRMIQRMSGDDPQNVQLRWNLSRAASRLGGAHLMLGEFEQAKQYREQCLELRQEIAKSYPSDTIRSNLADSHAKLGDVLRDMGETQPARQQYAETLAIYNELAESATAKNAGERLEALRGTYDRLGELHWLWLDDRPAAREHFEESLKIARRLLDEAPESVRARLNLAVACENLGRVYQLDDASAAREHLEEALDVLEELAKKDPENLLVQGHLALVLGRLGRHERASQQAEQLRLLSPEYARNLYNVACCYALCASAVDAGSDPAGAAQIEASLGANYRVKAIEALRQAAEHGLSDDTFLHLDPDLDPIRDEPAYQELIATLGRSAAPDEASP